MLIKSKDSYDKLFQVHGFSFDVIKISRDKLKKILVLPNQSSGKYLSVSEVRNYLIQHYASGQKEKIVELHKTIDQQLNSLVERVGGEASDVIIETQIYNVRKGKERPLGEKLFLGQI